MDFLPFTTSPTIIQFHAGFATLALILGPIALYRKRRDRLHRVTGYLWVLAMFMTASSSFFIHSFPVIGPFSPIHFLALLALYGIYDGVRSAVMRDFVAHQQTMKSVYWNGVVIASLFNFLPNRTVNQMLLGENGSLGLYIVIGGVVLLIARIVYLTSINRGAVEA